MSTESQDSLEVSSPVHASQSISWKASAKGVGTQSIKWYFNNINIFIADSNADIYTWYRLGFIVSDENGWKYTYET